MSIFKGDRLFVTLGKGCYSMEKDWDNRISSVDTQGNCIMAFDKTDCRGSSVELSPSSSGANDLKTLRFDNQISSISTCTRANDRMRSSMEHDSTNLKGGPGNRNCKIILVVFIFILKYDLSYCLNNLVI